MTSLEESARYHWLHFESDSEEPRRGVSKDAANVGASWFETRRFMAPFATVSLSLDLLGRARLLTMRDDGLRTYAFAEILDGGLGAAAAVGNVQRIQPDLDHP